MGPIRHSILCYLIWVYLHCLLRPVCPTTSDKWGRIRVFYGDNLIAMSYLNPCHAEQIKMPCPLLIVSQPDCWYIFSYWLTNSADPDQLASSEANWSGSTMFAKAEYIWVQQDQGKCQQKIKEDYLTLSMLGKIFSRWHFEISLIFPWK